MYAVIKHSTDNHLTIPFVTNQLNEAQDLAINELEKEITKEDAMHGVTISDIADSSKYYSEYCLVYFSNSAPKKSSVYSIVDLPTVSISLS